MDKLTLAILTIAAKVVHNNTNLDDELLNYVCPLTQEKLTKSEIEKISDEIKIKINIESAYKYSEVEDPALIVDPEGHEEWYFDWLKENNHNMFHWNQLKDFLEKQLIKKMKPEQAGEVIKSIDNASGKVLSRLQCPNRAAFNTKGLVLGYVQSGKTANFTAVIAKAVDAGYKMIVVLSGIHDNLRSQTQNRLDKELTGQPITDTDHVPIPNRPDKIWARMTGEGDFKNIDTPTLQELALSTRPILVVMKKKPQILKKLIKWVKEKCPEEIRRNIPLLVIDDEADQASINIGTSTKPTPTNEDIRTLLHFFRKNAYVGYTATPFANVLIDMGVDGKWGRDLYPRNFIVSLPRPDNYIGADQIFNKGYDKYFVKHVPDNEAAILKGKTKGKKNNPQLTEDLKKSVFSFILSAAARYARGDSDKPMTMLIHTTHYTIEHSVMKKLILSLIKEIKSKWVNAETRKDFKVKFEMLWKDDFSVATKELPYEYEVLSFQHVEEFIAPFLDKLEIFTLNSRSEDKLDYTKNPDIKVIAIGGNTLSRGLTLEGLMTSYFLRNSNTYDTLLQMGRWFGYREGYEDLTRVYTTTKIANHFEHLAKVEQEIREEIKRYEDDELTPAQVSVRIRAHQKLKVTSKPKMGAGRIIIPTFSDSLSQTTWLPLNDINKLRTNLEVGGDFVANLKKEYRSHNKQGDHLFLGVSHERIIEFLNAYESIPQPSFDAPSIIEYINSHIVNPKGFEIKNWNVGIVGLNKSEPAENLPVSFGGLKVVPSIRSRKGNDLMKVGVLTQPDDLTMDLSRGEQRKSPLLLLYLLWKESQPRKNNKNTSLVPLFKDLPEKENVLGVAIVFPKSLVLPNDYIAQPDGGKVYALS